MEPTHPKRILLIEDNVFIHDLYVRALQKSGYEVIAAFDGEMAVELAKTQPAVILLDVMLPKMNGIEVLRHLKADPATVDIPVVLLTNLTDDDIIGDAFNLGVQGYLLKVNVIPAELGSIVQRFITNPKLVTGYRPY